MGETKSDFYDLAVDVRQTGELINLIFSALQTQLSLTVVTRDKNISILRYDCCTIFATAHLLDNNAIHTVSCLYSLEGRGCGFKRRLSVAKSRSTMGA